MKIALVQNAPVQGDPSSSLQALDTLIGKGCGADIYVLPEMFATGQYIDPTPVVETMQGPIVQWLRTKARLSESGAFGYRTPYAHNHNLLRVALGPRILQHHMPCGYGAQSAEQDIAHTSRH